MYSRIYIEDGIRRAKITYERMRKRDVKRVWPVIKAENWRATIEEKIVIIKGYCGADTELSKQDTVVMYRFVFGRVFRITTIADTASDPQMISSGHNKLTNSV
jgi:hypothetical protein